MPRCWIVDAVKATIEQAVRDRSPFEVTEAYDIIRLDNADCIYLDGIMPPSELHFLVGGERPGFGPFGYIFGHDDHGDIVDTTMSIERARHFIEFSQR